MNQEDSTCKGFEEAAAEEGNRNVPPTLRALVAGRELVCGLDATELREMSKFTELPNVWGLAAHPILRPGGDWCDRREEAAWSEGVRKGLSRLIGMFPLVGVRGRARAAEVERAVQVFAPQNHARLAAAFAKLLRPSFQEDSEGEGSVHTLVIWPEPPCDKRGKALIDRTVAVWPAEGLTIVIGTDDPAAAARAVGWSFEEKLRPGAEVAQEAAAREQALAVGTMLFGVEVDAEGRIPALEHAGTNGAGWIVFAGID